MSIIYKKGSLFEAEGPNNILVQAVNCQGVWGNGIAKQFKDRYPVSFSHYKKHCEFFDKNRKTAGTALLLPSGNAYIGCLFTSYNYGKRKDSEKDILINTKSSINDLFYLIQMVPNSKKLEMHSLKINSGLFGVPWEETEKVIKKVLVDYPGRKWTVWSL